MKKLVALAMFGLAAANVLPMIAFLFLFGVSGVFATYVPAALTLTTLFQYGFAYFVSGFFPTSGGVSNWIIGL